MKSSRRMITQPGARRIADDTRGNSRSHVRINFMLGPENGNSTFSRTHTHTSLSHTHTRACGRGFNSSSAWKIGSQVKIADKVEDRFNVWLYAALLYVSRCCLTIDEPENLADPWRLGFLLQRHLLRHAGRDDNLRSILAQRLELSNRHW